MLSPFLNTEITILILLFIATLGSIYFKRLHIPYTVGLVLAGLLLGVAENHGLPIQQLVLSHDSIIFLFVPPLIFASASNLDHRLLFHNLTPALTLAVPGLIFSAVIVGGLLSWLTPLDIGQAMLFGALISATDPVAVVALFEELGVPKRLNMLVDGESMLNDATAIVAFDVVLSVLDSGVFHGGTLAQALIKVIIVLFGGVIVGVLTGTLMAISIKLDESNALLQATISLLVAYIAFIIAEHYLEVSGVIAVMTAGLMVGRYKSHLLKLKGRNYLDDFWSYVAFLANSLIFLLVGLNSSKFILTLPLTQPDFWGIILATILVVILSRGIMIFSLVPMINPFLKDGPINWRYQVVSFWGGLRGAVALALALSLAPDFPNRQLLIAMTLAVALFTIIIGGTTVGRLIHSLKLDLPSLANLLVEEQVTISVKKEIVEQLDQFKNTSILSEEIIERLKNNYENKVEESQTSLEQLESQLQNKSALNRQVLWLETVSLEKRGYEELHEEGFLSEKSLSKLNLFVTLKADNLQEETIPPSHLTLKDLQPRWEEILLKIARHFSPNSQWVQQQEDLEIKSFYELNVAIAVVSQKIIQRLQNFSQDTTLRKTFTPELIQECLTDYQFYVDQALEKKQALAIRQPTIDQEIQKRLAKQMTLVKSENKLAERVREGLISQEVAEKIYDQLQD